MTATTYQPTVISFVSSPEQRRRLRLVAAQQDVPMSEIIRQSVDNYLEKSA
jgi:hypothetical protein